jgi:hypothetical protein
MEIQTMFFSSWLRNYKRALECRSARNQIRRSRSSIRRAATRPILEALEDRLAPAVLTVNSLGDTVSGTTSTLDLREAIQLVNSGGTATDSSGNSLSAAKVSQINTATPFGTNDTIQFDPSLFGSTQQTITLGGSELLLSSNVTINGPGAGLLAISGNAQTNILEVAAGSTDSLSGLTMENAASPFGAVINSGTLAFTDCNVTGNSTRYGIFNSGAMTLNGCNLSANTTRTGSVMDNYYGGTMTLNGCTLSNNDLGYYEPVIDNEDQTITLNGCTVSNNTGVGIDNFASMTVTGCTVSGNTDTQVGGILNGGTMTLRDSTVMNNSAGNYLSTGGGTFGTAIAGGVFNEGTMTVSGCTLSGNHMDATDANGNHTPLSAGGGSALANFGPMTITDSTLFGNSCTGSGGAILNAGSLNLTGCTLTGNSTAFWGGAIFNGTGMLTVSGCMLSGNSSTNYDTGTQTSGAGGGIFDRQGGTVTIEDASASSLYGTPGSAVNSAVFGNSAKFGGDVENIGTLNVNHATVPSLDSDFLPYWTYAANPTTTVNVAAADTATVLTSSVSPSLPGQALFNVHVLAAQGGAPTGTVTLYDGSNSALGSAALSGGTVSFAVSLAQASNSPIHAVYSGDSSFSGSSSAPVVQTVVDAQTEDQLQTTVNDLAADSPNTGVQVTLDPNSFYSSSAQDIANAIAQITAPSGARVVITFNAPQSSYGDLSLSTQTNVSLVVNFANGTQVVGHSPALVVSGGDVTVTNATFTTATAAPTIQVTGGQLTLRNDVVQSSTAYNEPAIAVSGGSTLDMGTAASPGGNTISVNGAGQVLQSTGSNLILATGSNVQVNGAAISPFAAVTLSSSVNTSLLGQAVTFTATVGAPSSGAAAPTGTVTFVDTTTGTVLGVQTLSNGQAVLTTTALQIGFQTVVAVYSGDANYLSSAAVVTQYVNYNFGGFLAPLNSNLAFGLDRTVPIKFQLTGANGAFVSSLNAIVSLQVLNAQGTNVLTNPGSTPLRYDSTANQFVANWKTKGLTAGTYTISLVLANGTTHTLTVQLTTSNGASKLVSDGSDATPVVGALLAGDVELYVDNSNGDLTPDELARIQDAVAAVDSTLAPYGVTITEVGDPTQANATLSMDTTSAVGGLADGVLGCTTDSGQVTLIQGWNYYAGSDPTQISASQYDFQTVATHELGHVLGLGHSSDPTSVMYASLDTGTVKHALSVQDLNVPDTDNGACGLHVASPAAVTQSNGQGAPSLGLPGSLAGLLTRLETAVQASAATVPAGSSIAARDAAFIAAMGQIEADVQSAQWKSWGDAYSLLQTEEQTVLADLFALEDAFSTSMDHRRS